MKYEIMCDVKVGDYVYCIDFDEASGLTLSFNKIKIVGCNFDDLEHVFVITEKDYDDLDIPIMLTAFSYGRIYRYNSDCFRTVNDALNALRNYILVQHCFKRK